MARYSLDKEVDTLFAAPKEIIALESSISECSSSLLVEKVQSSSFEKNLHNKADQSSTRADICAKYIPASDSTVLRHPYYNYPAVLDPGIQEALFSPIVPITFADDGQNLYLHLCSEMDICPVGIFHRDLLKSEISLSYYGVDPKGIRPMAMALEFNTKVLTLNLTDNFLTDDSCYHLGQMLKFNKTLNELNLTGCRIGDTGLLQLGHNLMFNSTLVSLNLARNKLGDAGGALFAEILYNGVHIKKVNLSNNDLGVKTALAIFNTYEFTNPLTHLDLSWNSFYNVSPTVKMLNRIATSRNLQEINLSFNGLAGEQIANGIYSVLSIPLLRILDISHNRFCGEAINIIIPGLVAAKKLITLNLSFNPMSPEDAYNTLKMMLKPRVHLQNLLMETICVNRSFIELLCRVSQMKSRSKFNVVYGDILHNWTVSGPDGREVMLRRALYLSNSGKKAKVDILQYFLHLNEESHAPMIPKTFIDKVKAADVPLDEDYIKELVVCFPGKKIGKFGSINISAICEFIHRLWPDKKLPLPPPIPETTPELVQRPKTEPKKGKK